jgi:putative ABC transport system ATP-binding protein
VTGAHEPYLVGQDLTCSFADGTGVVLALERVSIDVARGELTLVVGPSGSGKTTLLTLLGLLRPPTSGTVRIGDTDTTALADAARAALRARLGLAFQEPRFLDGLDLLDNVGYPLVPRGVPRGERRRRASVQLERLGLLPRAGQDARRISGGERRRARLARALVAGPDAVLADEPTSGLDDDTARQVLAELDVERMRGAALLVVSHAAAVFTDVSSTVHLRDGRRIEH